MIAMPRLSAAGLNGRLAPSPGVVHSKGLDAPVLSRRGCATRMCASWGFRDPEALAEDRLRSIAPIADGRAEFTTAALEENIRCASLPNSFSLL
jgi:hypothetical protein